MRNFLKFTSQTNLKGDERKNQNRNVVAEEILVMLEKHGYKER